MDDTQHILQQLSYMRKNSCIPSSNEFDGTIVSKYTARVKWNSEVGMRKWEIGRRKVEMRNKSQ